MNIFVLDTDPTRAAHYHCDKHVVKMVLETAQILSTISGRPYKPTHARHPCTLWAGLTPSNYRWAWELGMALCAEYTYRYGGKVHKCEAIIASLGPSAGTSLGEMTAFAQAMPDEYRHPDAVTAYRAYYRGSKAAIANWTRRAKPYWWDRS